MEKEFCRVRSAKDIVLTTSIIITGSVLIALPTSASVNILGFFMICAGLILAFVLKTGYKDMSNGEFFSKSEKYFAQSHKRHITEALGKEPSKIDLSEEDKGNGIRLDIYFSRKTGKAYTQLFEYVPYKYEPCTAVFEHQLSEVESLIK